MVHSNGARHGGESPEDSQEVIAVLGFDPFRDMDRLASRLTNLPVATGRTPAFMPMDLYRSGDHYVLHADLPGVDPGSIDIGIDNNTLTIKAERTGRSEDGVQWIASERFTGSFLRQLSLGDGIDTDAIGASYENGVLTVTIPVADKAKPRKVQIQTRGDREVVDQQVQKPAVTAS
jgi:HSP20 family protein